jgi:hypothetical protein
LQLKKIQGAPEIIVSFVGGQKYRGVFYHDVKVSCDLKDKVSGNITYRRTNYLNPYVLMDGQDPMLKFAIFSSRSKNEKKKKNKPFLQL